MSTHIIHVADKPLGYLIPADASKVAFSRRGDFFQLEIQQTTKWSTEGLVKADYQQVTETVYYIGLDGSVQATCVYEKDEELVKPAVNVHDLNKERDALGLAKPERSRIIQSGSIPQPIKMK